MLGLGPALVALGPALVALENALVALEPELAELEPELVAPAALTARSAQLPPDAPVTSLSVKIEVPI